MPKEPVTIPGTDEVTDGGDADKLGTMDVIEKITGTGDARPEPPPRQDIPDDEIKTPAGMP